MADGDRRTRSKMNGSATGRNFAHTALLYDRVEQLTDVLAQFVSDGIEADEHVMVVLDRAKGRMLTERLGSDGGFQLADSADVYTTPTRTLAAYIGAVQDASAGGRAVRVAGEPTWAGRSALEVVEWGCVESACNTAFARSTLTMLCPYEVPLLDPDVVATARRTHPRVRRCDDVQESPDYVEPAEFHRSARGQALPIPATGTSRRLTFAADEIDHGCRFIETFSRASSVPDHRRDQLVAGAREVIAAAAAGGARDLSLVVFTDADGWTCDIAARWPVVAFPGFLRHPAEEEGRPGLWAPGQLCDLISVRERDGVTTVRLKISRSHAPVNPTCGEIAEFLGVYVLGACATDEAVLIEAHLAECTSCSHEANDLSHVVTTTVATASISRRRVRSGHEEP
jgi:hypothetical protein